MAAEWENDAGATGALVADQPEIKLFGRWSSSDVVVSDISLTVSSRFLGNLLFFYQLIEKYTY